MRKVVVVEACGSGKTSSAARALRLRHIEPDALHREPGGRNEVFRDG